jgi:hypothetical protein
MHDSIQAGNKAVGGERLKAQPYRILLIGGEYIFVLSHVYYRKPLLVPGELSGSLAAF